MILREYIEEKIKNTTKHFKFGSVNVHQLDDDSMDFTPVFKEIEKHFPPHYFMDLGGVEIAHRKEFDDRDISAFYKDNWLYITDKQDDLADLMDDLIHEMAHHIEVVYGDIIYSDGEVEKEFLSKRKRLESELKSEGYWTQDYDFSDPAYNKGLDIFLYKRVGPNMLKLATANDFIRPYASVSLREYFATGFEAYYLGKKDLLFRICPVLYNKIDKLHNL
jgi:hypothetical protein